MSCTNRELYESGKHRTAGVAVNGDPANLVPTWYESRRRETEGDSGGLLLRPVGSVGSVGSVGVLCSDRLHASRRR